jgi:hypothetical protein
MAATWRPWWHGGLWMLLLGWRHALHPFALFGGDAAVAPVLHRRYAVLIVIGALGHRFTRARQMVKQYPWMFEAGRALRLEAAPAG